MGFGDGRRAVVFEALQDGKVLELRYVCVDRLVVGDLAALDELSEADARLELGA